MDDWFGLYKRWLMEYFLFVLWNVIRILFFVVELILGKKWLLWNDVWFCLLLVVGMFLIGLLGLFNGCFGLIFLSCLWMCLMYLFESLNFIYCWFSFFVMVVVVLLLLKGFRIILWGLFDMWMIFFSNCFGIW